MSRWKTRDKTWSAGCWSTSSSRTRPAFSTSAAANGRSAFRGMSSELAPRDGDPAEQPIRELELWDLVSAFGRLIQEQQQQSARRASSTTTRRSTSTWNGSAELLHEQQRVAFTELFQPGMHKSTLVGMFLAILELVRHHGARAEQHDLFGEIWILPVAERAGDAQEDEPDESPQ